MTDRFTEAELAELEQKANEFIRCPGSILVPDISRMGRSVLCLVAAARLANEQAERIAELERQLVAAWRAMWDAADQMTESLVVRDIVIRERDATIAKQAEQIAELEKAPDTTVSDELVGRRLLDLYNGCKGRMIAVVTRSDVKLWASIAALARKEFGVAERDATIERRTAERDANDRAANEAAVFAERCAVLRGELAERDATIERLQSENASIRRRWHDLERIQDRQLTFDSVAMELADSEEKRRQADATIERLSVGAAEQRKAGALAAVNWICRTSDPLTGLLEVETAARKAGALAMLDLIESSYEWDGVDVRRRIESGELVL